MLPDPEFKDWQSFLDLIRTSVDSGHYETLLTMMMTSDERETLVARANIVYELLKGDLSQRQISQMLGVGVATITRGSNELKGISEAEKVQLTTLLLGDVSRG